MGYSALNTARCALSNILCPIQGISFGQHDSVKRLMTGFFNLDPPRPCYSLTWDVNKVLCFLRTLSPVHKISLKHLTWTLTMLLMLVIEQRSQTLHALDLKNCTKHKEFIFAFDSVLKHSKKGGAHLLRLD